MKALKICILNPSFLLAPSAPINGSQIQTYLISKLLAEQGTEVHFIAYSNSKKKYKTDYQGIQVTFLPKRKRSSPRKALLEIYQSLNETQPNLLYTRGRTLLFAAAVRWAQMNGTKHIWASNGDDSFNKWKLCSRLFRSNKSIGRKLLAFPLLFREDLYLNKALKNVPSAICQNQIQLNEANRKDKESLLMPSILPSWGNQKFKKEKRILWMGSLSTGKQPELFLDIAGTLKVEGWTFRLIGGKPESHSFMELKQKSQGFDFEILPQITWEDSEKEYNQASIYINTSLPESDGLPNSFLQAWANATPVLSLNHDPNNWMSQYDIGYCAHGDFNKLLSKCKSLMENPIILKQMGVRAQRFIQNNFDPKEIERKYLQLFLN